MVDHRIKRCAVCGDDEFEAWDGVHPCAFCGRDLCGRDSIGTGEIDDGGLTRRCDDAGVDSRCAWLSTVNDMVRVIGGMERDLSFLRQDNKSRSEQSGSMYDDALFVDYAEDAAVECYIDLFLMRSALDSALGFGGSGGLDSLIDILGRKAFTLIAPEDMRACLEGRGWTDNGGVGDRPIRDYINAKGDQIRCATKALADYHRVVMYFISDLAESEGCSQLAIYGELIGIRGRRRVADGA